MRLVIEDMLLNFKLNNLDLPRMKYDAESSGILKLHNKNEINKMKDKLTNVIACEDDGAFIFNGRESMMKGCRITCDMMAKLGLTAHVGCGEKNQRLNSCDSHLQPLSIGGEIVHCRCQEIQNLTMMR